MRRSDSLVPFSRRFFCIRFAIPRLRLWFAPAGPARVTGGPGVGDPGPRPDMDRGEFRASQVPGKPRCAYAVFFDPFVFNDTTTSEIYTLSLHDALPTS